MYINFERIIQKAKREFDTNRYQKSYIMNDIEFAKRYILDYIKRNPTGSAEELKQNILNSMYEDTQEFAAISNIKNYVFQYEIINLLIKNPDEITRLYHKVNGREKINDNSYYIDRPFEERKEDFMRELIGAVHSIKEENKELIAVLKKYKQGDATAKELINEKRKHMTPEKRKAFDEEVEYFLSEDIRMIKRFLPDCKIAREEELKQDYIKILGFIGRFLKESRITRQIY